MDALRAQLARAAARRWLITLVASGCCACSDAPAGQNRRAPSPQGEGGSPYSLDSALTIFRKGLEPVGELQNAESSLERLIAKFEHSIERADTAALRDMVMSRREFAYLYYPGSYYTRPPTKQEPGLAWFLLLQHSEKGITRLLGRFGGKPFEIVSNQCKPPRHEDGNVLWFDCVQRVRDGDDTIVIRLIGGVYERDGRFKIFSYGNDL